MRERLDDLIELLIDLRDQMEDDPDIEPDVDAEPDLEDEPSLGWTSALMQIGASWAGQAARHFDFDRELDSSEHGIADYDGLDEQAGRAV